MDWSLADIYHVCPLTSEQAENGPSRRKTFLEEENPKGNRKEKSELVLFVRMIFFEKIVQCRKLLVHGMLIGFEDQGTAKCSLRVFFGSEAPIFLNNCPWS